jgi:hypothetical protein
MRVVSLDVHRTEQYPHAGRESQAWSSSQSIYLNIVPFERLFVRMNLSAIGKKYDLQDSDRKAFDGSLRQSRFSANLFANPLVEYLWRVGESYQR